MSDVQDALLRPLDWRVGLETSHTQVRGPFGEVCVAPAEAPIAVLPGTKVSDYLTSRRKRLFDVVLALSLLVILSPLMIAVAFLIAVTSRGPIIFRQVRNGISGKPFTIYKFRSMTAAACRTVDVQQAQRGDSRITPVGSFIRRSSIDELPQLFNVINGSMSLVGPRPHAISHDAHYSSLIALYSWRFAARPGISGLAQTSGSRGGTPRLEDMERRVDLDVAYIRDASLIGDCGILMRTVVETFASSTAF